MLLHTKDELLQFEEQLPADFPNVNWPIWAMLRCSQTHVVETQQTLRKHIVPVQCNKVTNPTLMQRPLIHAAVHKLKLRGDIMTKRRGKFFEVVINQILEETGASAAQCVGIDWIRQQLPTNSNVHNKIGLVRSAKPNNEPILNRLVILEALEESPRVCMQARMITPNRFQFVFVCVKFVTMSACECVWVSG